MAISNLSAGPDLVRNDDPQWSPDGTRIAWHAQVVGGGQGARYIWIADSDGANRVDISSVGPDPDPIGNREVTWSPDGSMLAWSGWDGAVNQDIYVAGSDGSNRLNSSAAGLDPDPLRNESPVWSPDGTLIAWTGRVGGVSTDDRTILVAAEDGSGRLNMSAVGPDPDPFSNTGPVWSPDGSRILWSGIAFNNKRQVYVADSDGGNRKAISWAGDGFDPDANHSAVWSPDGSRIAWRGVDADGIAQIYVADADGSGRLTISDVDDDPDPIGNHSPLWSPDGSKILWQNNDPEYSDKIWIADADGANRLDVSGLHGYGADTGNPEWSPDGSHIAWSVELDVGGRPWDCPSYVYPVPFVDLESASLSHRDDIVCMYELEITAGTSPVTFSPHSPVTRQQMASLVARLFEVASHTSAAVVVTPFADLGDASSSHRDDIARVYGLGVSAGTSATTFSPLDTVTRQQMASFLARLYAAEAGALAAGAETPFIDAGDASPTHRDDIARVYGLGVTTGTSASTFSPLDTVTRQQMASFLDRLWRALIREQIWVAAADGSAKTLVSDVQVGMAVQNPVHWADP